MLRILFSPVWQNDFIQLYSGVAAVSLGGQSQQGAVYSHTSVREKANIPSAFVIARKVGQKIPWINQKIWRGLIVCTN
jgi:hypothetical protein